MLSPWLVAGLPQGNANEDILCSIACQDSLAIVRNKQELTLINMKTPDTGSGAT
jgi:hypothetical protein